MITVAPDGLDKKRIPVESCDKSLLLNDKTKMIVDYRMIREFHFPK